MGRGDLEHRRLFFVVDAHRVFAARGEGIAFGREQHIGRGARDGLELLLRIDVGD